MAKKPRPRALPAPAGYQDAPLERHGATDMGILWLRALDAIIERTPLDFLSLANIIGPDYLLSMTTEKARKAAIAGQNQRIAAILGVNVRTVQRYRLAATPERQGARAEVRGASARKRAELLERLGPVARDLILRRFLSLAEIKGLAGHFAGAFYVSKPPARHYARDGGVEGAEQPVEAEGSQMLPVIDEALAGNWEGAAWVYWEEWRDDWGISSAARHKSSDKQKVNWFEQSMTMGEENVDEVEEWELALGYPSPVDTRAGGAGDPRIWMFDDTLADYEASRPRLS